MIEVGLEVHWLVAAVEWPSLEQVVVRCDWKRQGGGP